MDAYVKCYFSVLKSKTVFSGMMFGAYFWGFFGDFKGRRFVILGSMGMDTLFSIFSCFTQGNVILFIIIRLGNGFA